MIISEKHANRMIRAGRAEIVAVVVDNEKPYAVLDRFDKQRTDHYPITQHKFNVLIEMFRLVDLKRGDK